MNTTLKLSAAVVLALGLASTAVEASAAMNGPEAKMHLEESGSLPPGQAKVIRLGTIHVTPADAEAAARPARAPHFGSTVYLGRIQVTPADSADAKSAALAARQSGAVFLGSIIVTADDSEDARYAEANAAGRGSVYLGSIRVTPTGGKSPIAKGMLAVERYLGSHPALAALGTLVFGRLGG
ncbi:MAG: hypothetical protein ACM3ZT_07455 [Bacillota bacterium]